MSRTRSPLRGTLDKFPADLVALAVVVVVANGAVFLPVVGETAVRPVVGLLFVLFAPGYALVAALFPARGRSPQQMRDGNSLSGEQATDDGGTWGLDRGIDWIERVALGFALSLAVVPLLALLVTVSPLAFETTSVFAAITAWTLGLSVVAVGRRLLLSADQRYGMTAAEFGRRARRSIIGDGSRGEILLNVALAFAVLFAVGSLGFAVLSPPDGETYTDVALLTESADGQLTAAEYPDSLAPNEQEQVYVRLENRERESIEYDVVVQLQEVDGSAQEGVVTDRVEVDRFSTTLGHGETEVTERAITAPSTLTGEDLRLQILLYEDGVPDNPTRETAYRKLHIWVDVGTAPATG